MVLAAVLLMPTALALDQEEILQDQSQSLGIEDLEEAGEAYTGQHDIEDGLDVGASFRHMAETGKEALGGVVKRSVRSCVLLLAVTLLCGLTEGVKAGTGGSGLGVTTLAATLSITGHRGGGCQLPAVHGGGGHFQYGDLGDVLLPTVSMGHRRPAEPQPWRW